MTIHDVYTRREEFAADDEVDCMVCDTLIVGTGVIGYVVTGDRWDNWVEDIGTVHVECEP